MFEYTRNASVADGRMVVIDAPGEPIAITRYYPRFDNDAIRADFDGLTTYNRFVIFNEGCGSTSSHYGDWVSYTLLYKNELEKAVHICYIINKLIEDHQIFTLGDKQPTVQDYQKLVSNNLQWIDFDKVIISPFALVSRGTPIVYEKVGDILDFQRYKSIIWIYFVPYIKDNKLALEVFDKCEDFAARVGAI
jgi:hypothetical protein